ncbi:FeoA family protein [Desulfovibrio intestinalis]|uniref:Fe2+ transport system protein FeoA n=1 Tax=Desulfovibrio intestinalis TaxID=58621 RepID=A0A7W8BYE2_9BACT|nr:FeoA family protein [Desulfovibrio intestinalis]MBB5142240.1 Fe2+ transport system protein FeoA [Desulfovibrio intestinalis]
MTDSRERISVGGQADERQSPAVPASRSGGHAWAIRALYVGMSGALLMYAGDMLLFGRLSNTDISPEGVTAVMQEVAADSPFRIMLGGGLGPLAGFLYAAGFYGVTAMVRREHPVLRWAIMGLFCLAMVYGGAYHSHYPHYAAVGSHQEVSSAANYINALTMGAVLPMALASLLFIYAVLGGKTLYRKYTVLFSPLPLILCGMAFSHLPSPLTTLVGGGWNNLLFLIFFGVCLRQTRERGSAMPDCAATLAHTGKDEDDNALSASLDVSRRALSQLAEVPSGGIASVCGVNCSGPVTQRLAALGLIPGCAVRVLRTGKVLVLECCGTFIAVGRDFARHIAVNHTMKHADKANGRQK